MDVYLIFVFISFLLYAQVSIYIFIALPLSRVNGLLLAITLLFAVFSLSVFFLGQLDAENKTIVFSRLAISSMLTLPIIFNYLFYFINDQAKPVVKKILGFFFLPAVAIISVRYNWDPVNLGVLSQIENGYAFFFYPVNWWKFIVLGYFVFSVIFALWQLFQWRKHAILKRARHQARIIFLSTWLFALSGLGLDVLVPGLGFQSPPFLIPVLGVPTVAVIFYSLIGLSVESYSKELISKLISGRISAYVIFFDKHGRIVEANHFARKSLGYGTFEIQEKFANQLFGKKDDMDFLIHASRYNEVKDHFLEIKTKEGTHIPVSVAVIRLSEKLWGHGGFILIAHDRKQIVKLEQTVQKFRDRMHLILARNTELKKVLGERTSEISLINAKLEKESQSISGSDTFSGHAKMEKETLTQEMYHRVKNNMQLVISLIHFMCNDPKLLPGEQEQFLGIVERIRKISSIHDVFYATPLLSKIDFGNYVRKTSEAFHHQHGMKAAIVFRVNTDDIYLSIRQALPCSIILNELLMNAYTHAFSADYLRQAGNDVTSVVSVYCKHSDDSLVLGVRDNGMGYESSIAGYAGKGIGLLVVKHLAQHILGASFTQETSFGTCVEIKFSTLV